MTAACCRPLEPACECMTCKTYSRAFLHNLVARGLPFAAHLMTYHNVAYTQALTRRMRAAIAEGSFPDFVRRFVRSHYPEVCPAWPSRRAPCACSLLARCCCHAAHALHCMAALSLTVGDGAEPTRMAPA